MKHESTITLKVNGRPTTVTIPVRTSLADLLRDHLDLTGTHLGCEHGVCGACTVLVDEEPVRSCITLAASCEDRSVTTIEGLDDELTEIVREAFSAKHGLQCGFCTPAMLVAARDIVQRVPDANEQEIRDELAGNICRCTGYVGIVQAVAAAQERSRERQCMEVTE